MRMHILNHDFAIEQIQEQLGYGDSACRNQCYRVALRDYENLKPILSLFYRLEVITEEEFDFWWDYSNELQDKLRNEHQLDIWY